MRQQIKSSSSEFSTKLPFSYCSHDVNAFFLTWQFHLLPTPRIVGDSQPKGSNLLVENKKGVLSLARKHLFLLRLLGLHGAVGLTEVRCWYCLLPFTQAELSQVYVGWEQDEKLTCSLCQWAMWLLLLAVPLSPQCSRQGSGQRYSARWPASQATSS